MSDVSLLCALQSGVFGEFRPRLAGALALACPKFSDETDVLSQ